LAVSIEGAKFLQKQIKKSTFLHQFFPIVLIPVVTFAGDVTEVIGSE
jgi:hypothetical protein